MDARKISLEKAGLQNGKHLAQFPLVISVLTFYVLLSVVTWILLCYHLWPDTNKAFSIAYSVTTGDDVLSLAADIKHPVLWIWLLIFRVISWLIVPILVAMLSLNAAYGVFEQKRLRSDRVLRKHIRRIAESAGFSGEQLKKIEDKTLEDMENDAGKE